MLMPGIDGCLTKPVDREAIRSVLETFARS